MERWRRRRKPARKSATNVPGFEDQVETIVDRIKFKQLIDTMPDNVKILVLIDDGSEYRSARLGDLSMQDALWMMRAFEYSVLFPRVVPRGNS